MTRLGTWRSFNKDAKLFLISRGLLAGYYTWPFWYGFATERLTTSQFGFFIAFAYIVGMFAEIPTGAFADRFGRRRSALMGAFLLAVFVPVVYLGRTFEFYLIFALFSGVGTAFLSGSAEALIYESKGMTKDIFRKVMEFESIFWQTGLIVATAIGGILYSVNPFLPFLAQTISFMIAFFVISKLTDDSSTKKSSEHHIFSKRVHRYLAQNKQGFMHLFEVRQLWPLIIFGVSLSVLIWAGIENLNEASMIYHGYIPFERGVILSVTKAIVLVLLATVVFRLIKKDTTKLIYLYAMIMLAYGLFSRGDKYLFLLGFVFFNLTSSVLDNYIRPIFHDYIEDKYRATAISTYSFLSSLFVALSSLIIGFALRTNTVVVVQRYLLIGFTILGSLSLLKFLRHQKDKSWQKGI